MVHVPHPDACPLEIAGEVLRHLFGQGGHQDPFLPGGAGVDFPDQVVDLALHRADLDHRVQQAGGADDLLHDLARAAALILPRSGGDIDHLIDPLGELLKVQRTVVKGAGQPEAVVHQGGFPGPIPGVHGPHLGEGHVALVDEQKKILGEVVQQGHGRGPGGPAGDDPAVILNAGAVAQLPHHLNVVQGALGDALGLQQLVVGLEEGHPFLHLPVDLLDGGGHFFLGGHIVGGRVDGHMVHHPGGGAGDHVDLADPVDLVPEELHPDGPVVGVDGENFHRVPPDPEAVAVEGHVVALIADLRELVQQLLHGPLLAGAQGDDHVGVVDGVPQAVNAGDRGHHDHIPPLKKGGGGGVAQALNLVVDGAVLLNEGVGVGDIGLWLVVVVVGDKVFHRIVGKELLELRAQLRGQGFVVGQDKGGTLDLLNDLSHGKGFAGAGHPQKGLFVQSQLHALGQAGDGLGLIPGGGVVADDLKFRHRNLPYSCFQMGVKRNLSDGCPSGRPCRHRS